MIYQLAFNSVTKVALLLAEDAAVPEGSESLGSIEYDASDMLGFETDPFHELHRAIAAKLIVVTRIVGQREPDEVSIQYAAD